MRLRASHLTKDFGHRRVVTDATLSVHPGEVVTIFGPNGAGKTTFIKILATLLKPTAGTLEIEGRDAHTDYAAVRRAMGVIIHEKLAYSDFSPYENLTLFGQLHGITAVDSRVKTLLAEVGLQRFSHEPLRIFSRGMTQRFMIARGLLHDPAILLLDEPFSGLDAAAQQFVLHRITEEQKKGTSIVITTHNTELGYRAGTRFLFMINGALEEIAHKEDTTPETLLRLYEERVLEPVSAATFT